MRAAPPSPHTALVRHPERGSYDRATICAILDEALVCHVGFVFDQKPFVLPTAYARIGDRLYLHGAAASRMLGALATGSPICVTVTLLDGLVLARSVFRHSMNYRSVVILGCARAVTDPVEKQKALEAIVEHVVPGRVADARPPSVQEAKATLVVSLPIDEASAKIRTGPPIDSEEDYALACWAGVIPLRLVADSPVTDPRLRPGTSLPPAVASYRRGGSLKRAP
ncbi:MAG TPA: pyridoxamine 5'-phosphate oxidase family protein [Polyangia bacterium]|nr:pyridoxamine 5'-phosphate oxidase family protein [Polyangia bacterium]